MLDFSSSLGRSGRQIGGALGGAGGALGGGGLMSTLGSLGSKILEPLDYPRQALANVGQAASNVWNGEGSLEDNLMKAAPGLAGALTAAPLIMSGVGAPLGILAGSLVGGAAQGIGKMADEGRTDQEGEPLANRFQAPEVSDITKGIGGDPDSFLQNMAVGAVTDPMTYAGGLGGLFKGKALGGALGEAGGSRLGRVANYLGPEYGGDPKEKIAELMKGALNDPKVQNRIGRPVVGDLESLINRPDVKRLAGEIAPGTKWLGAGEETSAGLSPKGVVSTIGMPDFMEANPATGYNSSARLTQPATSEINPAARSVPFKNAELFATEGTPFARVQHAPYLDMLSSQPSHAQDLLYADAQQALKEQLHSQGLRSSDLHFANFGQNQAGDFKILDPGGINPLAVGGHVPRIPELPMTEGTRAEQWLMRALGYPEKTQASIEQMAGSSLGAEKYAKMAAIEKAIAEGPAAKAGQPNVLLGSGDATPNLRKAAPEVAPPPMIGSGDATPNLRVRPVDRPVALELPATGSYHPVASDASWGSLPQARAVPDIAPPPAPGALPSALGTQAQLPMSTMPGATGRGTMPPALEQVIGQAQQGSPEALGLLEELKQLGPRSQLGLAILGGTAGGGVLGAGSMYMNR